MADASTLIREPGEALRAFNKRIRSVCHSTYVTDIDLAIVDGMPAVTLMTDVEEASEEDVQNGDAEKVGDPLSGVPLCAALAVVRAATDEEAKKAELELDQLYDLASGAVAAVEFVTAEYYKWLKNPDKPKGDRLYVPAKVTYALCTWDLIDEEEEEVDEAPEGEQDAEEPEAREVQAEVADDE